MLNDNYSVVEISDTPIQGVAERYMELKDQGLNESEIVNALSKEKSIVPKDRKVRSAFGDLLRKTIAILKGRTLVRDLGDFSVPVTWLVFDIPYKSRASLEWNVEANKQAQFSLKILGTGFGTGRSVSWSVNQTIEERSTPVIFVRDVFVNVKLYEVPKLKGDAVVEAETSVVGRGPVRLVSQENPTVRRAEQIDTSEYAMDFESAVDLEKYDVTLNETHTYSIDREVNVAVGLEALNLPVQIVPELSGVLSSKCSCVVQWIFTPKYIHQPYWDRRNRGLLPLWSIRK